MKENYDGKIIGGNSTNIYLIFLRLVHNFHILVIHPHSYKQLLKMKIPCIVEKASWLQE